MGHGRQDDFSQLSGKLDGGHETRNGAGDEFLFLIALFPDDGVRFSVGVPGVVILIKLDNPI